MNILCNTRIAVTVPLRIESTANKREHWAARAERAKRHRDDAVWALRAASPGAYRFGERVRLPCVVMLTRIAPRQLDSDNLAIGFKSVRDGVADWLGVDDNDKRITWSYAQERGAPKQYACRIEIKET